MDNGIWGTAHVREWAIRFSQLEHDDEAGCSRLLAVSRPPEGHRYARFTDFLVDHCTSRIQPILAHVFHSRTTRRAGAPNLALSTSSDGPLNVPKAFYTLTFREVERHNSVVPNAPAPISMRAHLTGLLPWKDFNSRDQVLPVMR